MCSSSDVESTLELRGLHGHGIIDAVARIDPIIGRDLRAGAERDQQAVGHVALREPICAARVRSTLNGNSGTSDHLVHVHVHRARDARQTRLDLPRELVIGGRVGEWSDHLHVDGRGQPEVEDLAHDIGGLEEERQVGVLALQASAELADVIGR